MGTSSPSTVTSPFNQTSAQSVQQDQSLLGTMGTQGQTAQATDMSQIYSANPVTQYFGNKVYNSGNYLKDLYGQAPQQQIADFNPAQMGSLLNIYGAGTGLGGLVDQGGQALGQSAAPISPWDVASFYNPMAGNVTAQMQNIFGQQNRQATGDAAKTAGGVGASRIGVAQGNLANQQALAAGQTYAGLYQNALQAAQQQKQQQLQAGMAGVQTGMGGLQAAYGAGAIPQQLRQQQLNALYQQQQQNLQLPFQISAAQNAALQSLGVLGGTTRNVGTVTGTQTGTQTGGQAGSLTASQTGQLGGQQSTVYPGQSLTSQIVGGGIAGLAGLSMLPSAMSGIGALFSDERAKTDVQRAGTDPQTGLNTYAFRYKGDPKTYPKVIGPMAQEVQQKYPGAVREMGRGGRAYQGGGTVPFTPMTNIFGSQAERFSRPASAPGPQGPVKSDLDAAMGDIAKYSKLSDLIKRTQSASKKYSKGDTFARVPNEPGPTEGGAFEGSQDQQTYQGPSHQEMDSQDYGYQEGGEVDDEFIPAEENTDFSSVAPEAPDYVAPNPEEDRPPPMKIISGGVPPSQNMPYAPMADRSQPVPLPAPRPRIPGGAPPEYAPERGLEPRPPRGGGGFLGGLSGLANDPRMAMLQAGLGIMAASGERDARGLPISTMGALGKGGMQGVNMLMTQREGARREQSLLNAQAQHDLDRAIRLRTLQFHEQAPVSIETPYGKTSARRLPDGRYQDISTGEIIGEEKTSSPQPGATPPSYVAGVDVSGGPTPPENDEQKETAASVVGSATDGKLFKSENNVDPRLLKAMQTTPEQFDFNAARLAKGDLSVQQNIRGTRQVVQQYVMALRSRAAQYWIDKGFGPQAAMDAIVEFGAKKAGARTIATREGTITTAAARAEQTAKVVIGASEKVDRTEYPDLNKIILAAKARTGNTDVVKYGLSMETFIQNYASAVGQGSTVLTDDARKTMEKRLQESWSKGQVRAVIEQGMLEIERELKGTKNAMEYYLGKRAPSPSPYEGEGAALPSEGGGLSAADREALDWAKANPDNPKSKAVKEKIRKNLGLE